MRLGVRRGRGSCHAGSDARGLGCAAVRVRRPLFSPGSRAAQCGSKVGVGTYWRGCTAFSNQPCTMGRDVHSYRSRNYLWPADWGPLVRAVSALFHCARNFRVHRHSKAWQAKVTSLAARLHCPVKIVLSTTTIPVSAPQELQRHYQWGLMAATGRPSRQATYARQSLARSDLSPYDWLARSSSGVPALAICWRYCGRRGRVWRCRLLTGTQ